jgi:RimJ/RimL family protein N-acetyltransferase
MNMIELEPFTNKDFSRLISWIKSEEELIQFAGPVFNFPLSEDQLEKYLENQNTNAYKIVEQSSQKVIGHCEIYLTETSAKLCRILIGEKSFRGKGLGFEVVTLLVKKCFNEFNYSLVELNVYDWNIGAIKCYKNAGFVVNPQKSKTIEVNSKTWTSINMVIKKVSAMQIKN